jgi:hypothetical protein
MFSGEEEKFNFILKAEFLYVHIYILSIIILVSSIYIHSWSVKLSCKGNLTNLCRRQAMIITKN